MVTDNKKPGILLTKMCPQAKTFALENVVAVDFFVFLNQNPFESILSQYKEKLHEVLIAFPLSILSTIFSVLHSQSRRQNPCGY